MKKIAIVSRALLMNGATKALVEMLKRVSNRGYQIDLWVLDFENAAHSLIKEIPENITIKKIPQYRENQKLLKNIMKHPVHYMKSLYAGIQLKRNFPMIYQWKFTAQRLPMIEEAYDVAISFRHFDIDVFFVEGNIRAKKKIFWIHGVQPLEQYQVETLREVYSKYDLICPVSKTAENNFGTFFPELKNKCKIAYCIVDAQEIMLRSLDAPKFERDHSKIIFTIGRLGEEKGIDLAVRTCYELIKNVGGGDVKWFVAGEGNQRNTLEEMIKNYGLQDRFILMGNIDNPYGYLATCDIYVQTSRLESYGLAINEAKIFNKPIVCTNIPAGQEQIENGITGVLVERDAKKMAEAIQMISEEKELRENLMNNLSKKDWSHFELVSMFEDMVCDR